MIVVAYQMVRAVEYLHSILVVNCDIKPDNFLVAAAAIPDKLRARAGTATIGARVIPRVFVSDMGHSAGNVVGDRAMHLRGTPLFLAPEFLFERGAVSSAADVWSLGVSICDVVFGSNPFDDPNTNGLESVALLLLQTIGDPTATSPWATRSAMWAKVLSMGYVPGPGKKDAFDALDVLPGMADVVRSMLVFEPESRARLRDVLAHPAFTKEKLPRYGGLTAEQVVLTAFPAVEEIPDDHTSSATLQQRAAPLSRGAPDGTLERAWLAIVDHIVLFSEHINYVPHDTMNGYRRRNDAVLMAVELLRGVLGHSGGTLPAEVTAFPAETAVALVCMAAELCEEQIRSDPHILAIARRIQLDGIDADLQMALQLQWTILGILDYDILRPSTATFVDLLREQLDRSIVEYLYDRLQNDEAAVAREARAYEGDISELVKAMCVDVLAELPVSGAVTSREIATQVFWFTYLLLGSPFEWSADSPAESLEIRRCIADRSSRPHTIPRSDPKHATLKAFLDAARDSVALADEAAIRDLEAAAESVVLEDELQ
jgi:hypothetical protein